MTRNRMEREHRQPIRGEDIKLQYVVVVVVVVFVFVPFLVLSKYVVIITEESVLQMFLIKYKQTQLFFFQNIFLPPSYAV